MALSHHTRKTASVQRLLLVAGVLTWGVVGATRGEEILRNPSLLASLRELVWFIAFVSFGVAYWRSARARGEGDLLWLGVQSVAALAVIGTGGTGVEGALLAIVAAQVAESMPQRMATAWVVAQSVAMLCVFLVLYSLERALLQTLIFVGFQGFTLGSTIVMVREALGRAELARLHVELHSAQALLAAREREGERLRIARELHDSLGHHLTALSLNLEAAVYTAREPDSLEHLRRAREASRVLMAEVRQSVSALRESPTPLLETLRELAQGAPGLTVHLDVPGALVLASAEATHSLIRCVQEVLTNTLRHAQATQLWVRITSEADGGVRVLTRDDGQGANAPTPGAGLRGMRERFVRLGGHVEWRATVGRGWELEAWLPAACEAEAS
ncbi:sensor histidine kinase [Myxococcus stipitatus]|uniref:sensor histidine kinase n=1 Tax=Myxococcus stipitatus TaxID=83455 RepID=UPI0030CF5550